MEMPNAEIRRSLAIKRTNAITAAAAGGALTAFAANAYGFGPPGRAPLVLLLGLFTGLIYANGFEYVLHRFLLHWGAGFLVGRHALHHDSADTPEEPRYVNFATSPLVVALLFAVNALPVFALERLLHLKLAAGMFASFTIYYILYEEVHWRMHLGGWLPGWLQAARRHHMLHHGGCKGRYNVFLPIFDWIFERHEWKRGASGSR
jgi:Fatty acid hydroxylase superfamily